MLGRLNQCFGQNDVVQYQPVAGDVVDVPEAQDNTEFFNQIPKELLVLIADKLPQEDLIPFFLTNKRLLQLFENFKGNKKLNALRVFMPTSQKSLYEGAPAQVSFGDVNHLLMAQYFLNIKMKDLESCKDEIKREDCKRECLVIGGSVALGVTIGLVIHAGVAALLDRVVLPACFECRVTTSTANECMCGGNILTAPDKVFVGMDYVGDISHGTVPHMVSKCKYVFGNIFFCYIPVPMVASLPAGFAIGCAPTYEPCQNYMLEESYDTKHESIDKKLKSFNSSSNDDFQKILELNESLRIRKIGGASYRMFHAPAEVKMQDDTGNPQLNSNNDDAAPSRIVME